MTKFTISTEDDCGNDIMQRFYKEASQMVAKARMEERKNTFEMVIKYMEMKLNQAMDYRLTYNMTRSYLKDRIKEFEANK